MKKGNEIIKSNIEKEILFHSQFSEYDRKKIGKRAYQIFKSKNCTWGESQRESWAIARKTVLRTRKTIKALKSRLNALYIPEKFVETEAYAVGMMYKAFENGAYMNKRNL